MGGYKKHSFSTKHHPCPVSSCDKTIQYNQYKQKKVHSNDDITCIEFGAKKIVAIHFFPSTDFEKEEVKLEKDLEKAVVIVDIRR